VILLDVNVLVYACRRDADRHAEYHAWLSETLNGDEPVGIYPESLGAVVRITTHARVWKNPITIADALAFTDAVRSAPASIPVQPGDNHWSVFTELCTASKIKGNLVPDAWIAALAIENGCTLVTTDADFARFRGLRWQAPL
jgi:hypothetical protein